MAFCLSMIAPFHTDEYVGGFVSFHSSQASILLHPDSHLLHVTFSNGKLHLKLGTLLEMLFKSQFDSF